MKKEDMLLIGLLILVLAGLVFAFMGFTKAAGVGTAGIGAGAQSPRAQPSSSAFPAVSTGSTDSGDVSIELTPQGFVDGKLVVGIAVNTHSVDLSQFDMKTITTLSYGGKTVTPVSAPQFSGHHNNGQLLFEVGADTPSSFVIAIKGIPKVEERVFRWG